VGTLVVLPKLFGAVVMADMVPAMAKLVLLAAVLAVVVLVVT
jgi:hypothetical protein